MKKKKKKNKKSETLNVKTCVRAMSLLLFFCVPHIVVRIYIWHLASSYHRHGLLASTEEEAQSVVANGESWTFETDETVFGGAIGATSRRRERRRRRWKNGLEPREVARDELREERVGEQREWVLFRGREERVTKYRDDDDDERREGREDGEDEDEESGDRKRADEKLGPRRAEKSRRRGEFNRRRSAETVNTEAKKIVRSDDEQTRERQR